MAASKAGMKMALVAGAAGVGAIVVGGLAASKIAYMKAQPYALPIVLLGIGVLLARRGRTAIGLGIAGAAAAIAYLVYAATKPLSDEQKKALDNQKTAGYDAGAYLRPDHGVYDALPEYADLHARGVRLLQAGAFGDAGALFGGRDEAGAMLNAIGMD